MKIDVRGEAWELKYGTLPGGGLGECHREKKLIIIRPMLGERHLNTLLHELTHACLWDLDEEAVDEIAETAEKVLRRSGYYRRKRTNGKTRT